MERRREDEEVYTVRANGERERIIERRREGDAARLKNKKKKQAREKERENERGGNGLQRPRRPFT